MTHLKDPRHNIWFSRLSRFGLWLLSHFQAEGHANFPDPPYIVVSNHLSYFDALVAGATVVHDVSPITAKKFQGRFLGWLLERFIVPLYIQQESPDRAGLKNAMAYVEAGHPIAVAPEGHRSRTGALMQPFEGPAYLIRKLGVPVVPMAIWGTERILKAFRPQVRVQVGKPFHLPPTERASRDQLKSDTDLLMCSIAAMLPDRYHGVYAGHPLIEEMKSVVC